ncbi:MAG TPA: M67 family metallopeptidase [Acidimicrobiales bacterium]|jgi:proteasome lid subunit RPN8/RPN11|nr:M67 family metallopeptidase [Acidimicrobiales bacterium]
MGDPFGPAPSASSVACTQPGPPRLHLERAVLEAMVAHCLSAYPEEGCGLLVGVASTGEVRRCYPTRNAAQSARLYSVDGRDHLRADREASAEGLEIVGVFHSHTHTDAYPSPTDVAQAPDPAWHYVVVSLRDEVPSVRSYRIDGGRVVEEAVELAR